MAAIDLVTLNELKVYAGINSNTYDAQYTSLITKVSQFVRNMCNRTFIDWYTNPKTEVQNGGSNYIYLYEAPIVQLVSFEISRDFGKTYTLATEFTDYVLDVEEDRIVAINNMNSLDYTLPPFIATVQNTPVSPVSPYFRKHPNGYRITYRAGYAAVPEDLKLAVMDLVLYYAKSDMAVKSPRSPGSNTTAIEYITTTNLPSHIRRVITNYILAR